MILFIRIYLHTWNTRYVTLRSSTWCVSYSSNVLCYIRNLYPQQAVCNTPEYAIDVYAVCSMIPQKVFRRPIHLIIARIVPTPPPCHPYYRPLWGTRCTRALSYRHFNVDIVTVFDDWFHFKIPPRMLSRRRPAAPCPLNCFGIRAEHVRCRTDPRIGPQNFVCCCTSGMWLVVGECFLRRGRFEQA